MESKVKYTKPLLVILGPTASGKTGLSIEIAQEIGGEVINADSRQLYKYLDIGTAKITPEEIKGIPHHLIDVLDPKEEAAAGWYQIEAKKVIDEVLNRKKVPMLVGGSMLYISAVIDGLTMAPEADPEIRNRLMAEYDRDGGKRLHARLQEIDPEAASRIHPNNKPRLVRAVEIFELTNQPKTTAVPKTELRASVNKHDQKYCSTCPYDLLVLGLDWPREVLHERINKRTKMMFEAGWVDEVKELVERGYTAEDPGMKSHGYREIINEIDNGLFDSSGSDKWKVESGKLDENETKNLEEEIAAKTRQYARRQLTWWRGDDRIIWISKT